MQETPYSFFITHNILEQIASFHFFTLKIIILAEQLRVIYLIKACWCQEKKEFLLKPSLWADQNWKSDLKSGVRHMEDRFWGKVNTQWAEIGHLIFQS